MQFLKVHNSVKLKVNLMRKYEALLYSEGFFSATFPDFGLLNKVRGLR